MGGGNEKGQTHWREGGSYKGSSGWVCAGGRGPLTQLQAAGIKGERWPGRHDCSKAPQRRMLSGGRRNRSKLGVFGGSFLVQEFLVRSAAQPLASSCSFSRKLPAVTSCRQVGPAASKLAGGRQAPEGRLPGAGGRATVGSSLRLTGCACAWCTCR